MNNITEGTRIAGREAGRMVGGFFGMAAGVVSGVTGLGRGFGGEIERGGNIGAGLGEAPGRMLRELGGDPRAERAAGRLFQNEDTREMAFDVLTGKKGSVDRINLEISNMRNIGKKMTAEQRGTLASLQLTKAVAPMRGGRGIDDLSGDELEEIRSGIAEARGMAVEDVTLQDVEGARKDVFGAASAAQRAMRRKAAVELRRIGRADVKEFRAGGIAEMATKEVGPRYARHRVEDPSAGLVLSKRATEQLTKQGGEESVQAAEMALEIAQQQASLKPGDDDALGEFLAAKGNFQEVMRHMSTKGMKGLARGMAGTGIGGMAAGMIARGERFAVRAKRAGGGQKGAIAGVLGTLGVGGLFGKDELKGLAGKSSEEVAALLSGKLDIDDKDFTQDIEKALEAATGKTGLKGKAAARAGAAFVDDAAQNLDEDARDKLRKATGQKEDPTEKLAEKIGEGNRFLEALVNSNKQATRHLAQMSGEISKLNPEKEKT
jgi:hypothetical protein